VAPRWHPPLRCARAPPLQSHRRARPPDPAPTRAPQGAPAASLADAPLSNPRLQSRATHLNAHGQSCGRTACSGGAHAPPLKPAALSGARLLLKSGGLELCLRRLPATLLWSLPGPVYPSSTGPILASAGGPNSHYVSLFQSPSRGNGASDISKQKYRAQVVAFQSPSRGNGASDSRARRAARRNRIVSIPVPGKRSFGRVRAP
jgi:hypothetical protein